MTFRTLIWITIALLSVGCARKTESQQSNFLNDVAELWQHQENFDLCDYGNSSKKIEIAQALDKHEDVIRFFTTYPTTYGVGDTQYNLLDDLGPTKVWRTVRVSQKPSQWIELKQSWDDLYSYYQRIKETKKDREWPILASKFQFLLSNDRWRIVEGANLLLDIDSKKTLESIVTKLDQCLETNICSAEVFSRAEKNLLENFVFYSRHFANFKNNPNFQNIMAIRTEVASDMNRYTFLRNSRILRVRENGLQVPLYTSDFSKEQSKLTAIIQQFWNQFNFEIDIRWEGNPYDFKIIFIDLPGGRPNVTNAVFSIYPNPMDTALAHEFGHILGFNDEYYVVWRPETCSYVQKSNVGNIMSNSEFGSVLPSHIDTLKLQYPQR